VLDCGKWLSSEGWVHLSAFASWNEARRAFFSAMVSWFWSERNCSQSKYIYIYLSLCYVVLKCGNNPLFVLASLVDAEPLMLHTTPGCFAKKKGAHKIFLVKPFTQIGL